MEAFKTDQYVTSEPREGMISTQEQDDISISENCLRELLGTTSSWLEGEKVPSHILTNRTFFCSFVWGCKILICIHVPYLSGGHHRCQVGLEGATSVCDGSSMFYRR